MAKIAISLPDEVLKSIEQERKASGETRSEFLRRAVEALLHLKRGRQLEEQYIRGYQEHPENAGERAGWEGIVAEAWADLPWEDGDDRETR